MLPALLSKRPRLAFSASRSPALHSSHRAMIPTLIVQPRCARAGHIRPRTFASSRLLLVHLLARSARFQDQPSRLELRESRAGGHPLAAAFCVPDGYAYLVASLPSVGRDEQTRRQAYGGSSNRRQASATGARLPESPAVAARTC